MNYRFQFLKLIGFQNYLIDFLHPGINQQLSIWIWFFDGKLSNFFSLPDAWYSGKAKIPWWVDELNIQIRNRTALRFPE